MQYLYLTSPEWEYLKYECFHYTNSGFTKIKFATLESNESLSMLNREGFLISRVHYYYMDIKSCKTHRSVYYSVDCFNDRV